MLEFKSYALEKAMSKTYYRKYCIWNQVMWPCIDGKGVKGEAGYFQIYITIAFATVFLMEFTLLHLNNRRDEQNLADQNPSSI
jgi:hypothetical protein